ncbi:MAG: tRNA lysidine(34) synthetase TilS, partial [Bacteroidota bacterium]
SKRKSSSMLDRFLAFLEREQLLNLVEKNEKILLAISGGVDSVVLAHLFAAAELPFGLAHCNFQLRGAESDADEAFVQALGKSLGKPVVIKRFATASIAQTRKQSIQLVARELRYEWLERVRQAGHYQYIATAHHLDDALETLLFNLTKGTGIRGFKGIPIKNGVLIRPLLFCDKSSILTFAQAQNYAYREDASNETDQYTRNRIRHHIVPVLRSINPALSKNVAKSLQHLRATEQLFHWAIVQIRSQLLQATPTGWQISWTQLHQYPAPTSVLFELLHPYGFQRDQIQQLLATGATASGQQFISKPYRLYRHRDQILLEKASESAADSYWIEAQQNTLQTPQGTFHFQKLEAMATPLSRESHVVDLDFEALHFPLCLRRWQSGDRFQPLGMGGRHQKLKVFFVNQKLAIPEKQRICILESNQQICWVVGQRIDERYKIRPKTTHLFRIRWQPKTQ